MTESFRNLVVWQKAKALVAEIYKITQLFPREEIYGLTAQLRRAAISIASNIAEGKGRNTDRDFKHFLRQARGSLYELENQLEIASELGYLPMERLKQLVAQCDEVGRLLNGLINKLGQN